jgi:hypothetical protein
MARAERRRRPHPAASARVLATGLSVSAMMGLTAGMTAQSAAEAEAAPDDLGTSAPAVTTEPPRVAPATVVIVRRYVVAPAPDAPARAVPAAGGGGATTVRAAPSQPKAVPPAPPRPRPVPAAKPDAVTKGSG